MFWRQRRAREQDLQQELDAHLELEREELEDAGITTEEADYAARRALGNRGLVAEDVREAWGWMSIERLGQDLQYALRQLRQRPGFTAVAVLTLALGIGANTAVFSIINAVLLARPPFTNPDQLVTISQSYPTMGATRLDTCPAEYLDYREQNRALSAVAGYARLDFDLTGGGEAERIPAVRATSNLFATLGVSAQSGRVFTTAEDHFGAPNVAVLSDRFWHRRFNRNPKALGSTLRLDETVYTIIGVMPPGFDFPTTGADAGEPPAVWVPMAFSSHEIEDRAASYDTSVVARMREGTTLAQAQADVKRIARDFQRDLPKFYDAANPLETMVSPLGTEAAERVRPAMLTLAAAVAFVLLIACANVANLLLARGQVRQREMAVRTALGASVGRLARQLFTESVLLTLAGGAMGCALAMALTRAAARWWPEDVVGLAAVHVNGPALLFTLVLSMLTGILCGLAPAIGWTRPNMGEALRQGGRQIGGGRGRQRLQRALVVAEAASAVVLLVGTGLLLRSFGELLKVPPGFDPRGVELVRTSFNRQRYPDGERRRQAQAAILARLAAIPGVTSAALSTHIPLVDERNIGFVVEGKAPTDFHWASNALVSGNYFRTMGIPLRRGRTFDDRDTPDHPLAIVVNETLARQFWPNEDALGKRLKWSGLWLTVVGIAGDVRLKALDAAADPTIYGNVSQAESGATAQAVFLLRSVAGPPERLRKLAGEAIRQEDAGLPVFGARTMTEVVARSIATRRFVTAMLVGFAALSLMLAAIGFYGVLSYAVAERTQELGVRLALGAPSGRLLRHVVAGALRLVGLGLVAGLAGGMLLARLMGRLLFGVAPLDPAAFISASALFLAVALAASYLPARRAARVDPMTALRCE